MSIVDRARALRYKIEALADDMDDTNAVQYPDLFHAWKTGTDYKTGDRIRYGTKLYKCLQAHKSQDDWTPDAAVSLWVEVADPSIEWPAWKQPTGAHDAYNKGDKVSYNGHKWTSDINANVYEPGVYGWTDCGSN